MKRQFYRVKEGKKIFGLCNGLAEYTGTDVILWRLILIALFFTPFPSILFYIIGTIATESK